MRLTLRPALFVGMLLSVMGTASAQGTSADYERAEQLRTKYFGLVPGAVDEPSFSADSRTLVYRRSLMGGGYEFVKVDIPTLQKSLAFDHHGLARSLGVVANRPYDGRRLPFQRFDWASDAGAIEFDAGGSRWNCAVADYACTRTGEALPVRIGDGTDQRQPLGKGPPDESSRDPLKSPDGSLEAFVRGYNIYVRTPGASEERQITFDGAKDRRYVFGPDAWSPDSRMLAVSRNAPGDERFIHYIDSSPEDQKQPVTTEMLYVKPGDKVTDRQPVLIDITTGVATVIDRALFPNAYWQSDPQWWKDGRGFYISYNQRGHQAYRIVEVNRQGIPRILIDERVTTYFEYSSKRVFEPVNDGREIVWMSERDGWAHLYLYDGVQGRVKRQITKGKWAVRSVLDVDAAGRTITFAANGMRPGEDPYFVHYYRINFDGTGLVALTDGDGTHSIAFSPDKKTYVDIWSRVDLPPIAQLRRASDAAVLMELERADASALLAAGWTAPEPFVAKGRDGVTDIYGVIVKPSNFDPAKKYPVIESIYAGPQGAFTPKSFLPYRHMHAQAELGFIVVQMDGMGTNYRSKAFHDVSWKNLADAGFPDRILWHQAAAAEFPWYDIDRVGIYGGSAGGQNAMAALLFHPHFYDAAFSFAGSHDNRMDKIWWNEQYMGWPIGPHYSASSNVDNAWRLQGKLMLVVGELDTNVDPSTTFQVVDALIKAGKTFDFVFLPGVGHSEGGQYGERKRWDFFVRELLGATPPDRNAPKSEGSPLPALRTDQPSAAAVSSSAN